MNKVNENERKNIQHLLYETYCNAEAKQETMSQKFCESLHPKSHTLCNFIIVLKSINSHEFFIISDTSVRN